MSSAVSVLAPTCAEGCSWPAARQVKLVDTQTLEVLKVFATDRPANAAALSPIFDQARALGRAELTV